MDLLDSILRTSEAEEYISNFRNHGIDAFTLKLLNDEDLQIVGISEQDKRAVILQNVSNLQIPSEKKCNIDIGSEYVQLVLYQISQQVHKHLANLACATMRDDIIICNNPLLPATKTLNSCISSFEKKLIEFEEVISERKKRYKISRNFYMFSTFALIGIGIFTFTKYRTLAT